MLFQGQEFARVVAVSVFRRSRRRTRRRGPRRARRIHDAVSQCRARDRWSTAASPIPRDPATFERCKLDHRRARTSRARSYALHRDLLRLRQRDAAIRSQRVVARRRGACATHAFVLRWFFDDGCDDRLLVVNLGSDADADVGRRTAARAAARRGWRIRLVQRGSALRRRAARAAARRRRHTRRDSRPCRRRAARHRVSRAIA